MILLEARSETNKSDSENPTLTYGFKNGYSRCYQIDEFVGDIQDENPGSFRMDDGIFVFLDPDWRHRDPQIIDPITNQPWSKEFSVDIIEKLRNEIIFELQKSEHTKTGFNNKLTIHNIRYKPVWGKLNRLLSLINQGLAYKTSNSEQLRIIFQKYKQFNDIQKEQVQFYFAWMFIFGMWMRFWKGPEYDWSKKRVDVKIEKQREEAERCDPEQRDYHVNIQKECRDIILSKFDPEVLNWINSIPRIVYEFTTKRLTTISRQLLNNYITGLMSRIECEGFGGDRAIENAYFYSTTLFVDSNEEFNNLIEKFLPQILDVEREAVDKLIKEIGFNPDEKQTVELQKVIAERYHSLKKGNPKLKPFTTEGIEFNIHV